LSTAKRALRAKYGTKFRLFAFDCSRSTVRTGDPARQAAPPRRPRSRSGNHPRRPRGKCVPHPRRRPGIDAATCWRCRR
jgi:hypothetical protein